MRKFDVQVRKSDGIIFYFIDTEIVSKEKFEKEWLEEKGFPYYS